MRRRSPDPAARQNRLAQIAVASPSRLTMRRRGQTAGDRADCLAPTTTTPTQVAGLPKASTIENTADSMKPITRSATPMASSVCSRTGSRRMWRMPASTSSRKCVSSRTGASSGTLQQRDGDRGEHEGDRVDGCDRRAAERREQGPPRSAARPGAAPPCWWTATRWRRPAVSSGSISLSSPLIPAGKAMNEMP